MSEWDKIALARLHDGIEASSVFLALFTEKYKEDPTCLVQLGFALMLGKPIYLLVPEGLTVPPGLARIADGIETYRVTEDMGLAVERLMKKASL